MSSSDEIKTHRLYVNGQWIKATDPMDVVNPSTGDVFARIGTVGREGVRDAFDHAAAAYDSWRKLTGLQRGDWLRKIADGIEARIDEFARTITLENGKPLLQSKGEMGMTVDHLRWFAEEARRTYGRVIPHQIPGKRHLVLKSPIGVVGAIAPWNFPLVLAMRKVAPALAAGCPVVLKPASATPISASLLAEVIDEVGLPAGVFNLVAGKASAIGAEMLENPICKKISFTGSTEVGRELIRGAADGIKKLSLELGGHAPVLVFEDADLDAAVQGAVITKFRNTGQSCIAANRIYVQRGIFDKFVQAFVAATEQLKIGDGFGEGVEIGPMIEPGAVNGAMKHIEDAVQRGAKVVCGGKPWNPEENTGANPAGTFLEPTILTDVPDDALCMTEETFAPIAPVCVFDDEDEVIAKANDTVYGLAAYAFTNNLSRAWRLAEELEAGTIGLNDAVPATSISPFGGAKQSGWGRELGIEGLDAYMETKHISLGLGI